jgi:hypothetical protein
MLHHTGHELVKSTLEEWKGLYIFLQKITLLE